MAKARKEGEAKAAPKAKARGNGVKHARALADAIEFYQAEYPEEFADERNVPFAGHIETVIARLQQK